MYREIKAIFFDVDGTLLSYNSNDVPAETRRSLARLRSRGIKTVVATGRDIIEFDKLPVSDIKFDGYLTLNGNLVLDENKKAYAGTPIDRGEMEVLAEMFSARKIPFVLIGENERYINFINETVIKTQQATHGTLPRLGNWAGEKVYQIVAFVAEREKRILDGLLDECAITSWNDTGIDIIPRNGGKSAGINRFMEQYGIDPGSWLSAMGKTICKCWSLPGLASPWAMQVTKLNGSRTTLQTVWTKTGSKMRSGTFICSTSDSIPFGKADKKPPVCMSTDAVKTMLSLVDTSSIEGLRHLAILSLMYDSGCRVQELIDLNVTDFHAGKCCRIYVHGKGNKYRSIPLLCETEKIVAEYIRRFHLPPESPMFCNKKGERLTRQGIRYIIQKYSALANAQTPGLIDGPVHPHRLRHSKASHLVDGGVNIYNVRDFLGHESVATTQIYLTSNPEVTRKAIESIAAETVPDSVDYYSKEERDDLLSFLESLG